MSRWLNVGRCDAKHRGRGERCSPAARAMRMAGPLEATMATAQYLFQKRAIVTHDGR